jgi:para-nitrobenzyl esterase
MVRRRSFIGMGMAAGALAGAPWVGAEDAPSVAAEEAPRPDGSVVETTTGKVRGARQAGVHSFKGVPYAASTAGAARFMPPRPALSWTGVRDCLELGHRAPQLLSAFHGVVPHEVEVMDRNEPMGEDCLVLNVWTPRVGRRQRRPVMLWLHGGGYTSGSGGFVIYDGTRLAEKHDVVVVTVNHRLNALGYLYLGGFNAERYAASGNVGNLDIVAALTWVRDNIDAFGGDPHNVTIFGQSGGGGKVSALMAMPSARGLFHRAIVQSGAAVKGMTREAASANAERFLKQLQLTPSQLDRLESLPFEQLVNATQPSGAPPVAFGPVVDGQTLPGDPFDPVAPALSAQVPLLIGTVETEVTFFPNQLLDPIDDQQLRTHLKQVVRKASDAQIEQLIAAYRAGRPQASNTDLYLIIASDATFRAGVATEAERKAAQGQAPVYQYYFTWRSPVREGKLRSFHTLEIPFVFDNVDGGRAMTGTGSDRYALATRMSDAWVAFARSGDPNHPGLPHWAPFDTRTRATMVLNDECRLVNDPYGAEQKLLHSIQASA